MARGLGFLAGLMTLVPPATAMMKFQRLSQVPVATTEQLHDTGAPASGVLTPSRASFPQKVLVAYTAFPESPIILRAVRAGVNVVVWTFIELANHSIVGEFDPVVIRQVHEATIEDGLEVVHMVSIGGWNVEHTLSNTCGPSPCSGSTYAASFREWNEKLAKLVGKGWRGFDGVDWDVEGVDNAESASNEFTAADLDVILEMSNALRSEFLISLVPPQSYFNCLESGFDLSLRHPAKSEPTFHYAGLNAYAPLYAKSPETFDLVMIQLYEGYSDAGFDLYWEGSVANVGEPGWPRRASTAHATEVIQKNVQCLSNGEWSVDFNGFWGLPNKTHVQVPLAKIVLGLGNGWTMSGFKFPYFEPTAAVDGRSGARGFMYWSMANEDPDNSFTRALAKGLGGQTKQHRLPSKIA